MSEECRTAFEAAHELIQDKCSIGPGHHSPVEVTALEREVTRQLAEVALEDERRALESYVALTFGGRRVLGFERAKELFEITMMKQKHMDLLGEILKELEG